MICDSKYIIFDFDGVIVDSERIYFKYWNLASSFYGKDLSEEEALSLRSCDSSIAKEIWGNEELYLKVRNKRRELVSNYLNDNKFELKSGIKEAFEYLKNKGYIIIIATSSSKEMVEMHLNYYELTKYVHEVLSVKSLKRGKPYPDIYIEICKHYNLKPSTVLAVEDSPNGVISASDALINVIMIPDLSKPTNELLKRIYKVVNNPKELIYLL